MFQEIKRGWKPGAVSKRLLRLLNKAKRRHSTIELTKPTKKVKKRVEEKPTLIVCKRNGEYIIEMQVDPGVDEGSPDSCSPLVYKIAKADNPDRIRARAKKERRLIRQARREVWSDPYRPEICEQTCFKAYQQAVGLLPYDPNNPDCTCSEEDQEDEEDEENSCSCDDIDVSSDCSSLDLDWEIHFTPPIAYFNNLDN